jgi:hypothetical protein
VILPSRTGLKASMVKPPKTVTEKARKPYASVPSGMSVWAVIMYLKYFDWDREKTVDLMEGALTNADIEFAERYYSEHRDEIDAKLSSL